MAHTRHRHDRQGQKDKKDDFCNKITLHLLSRESSIRSPEFGPETLRKGFERQAKADYKCRKDVSHIAIDSDASGATHGILKSTKVEEWDLIWRVSRSDSTLSGTNELRQNRRHKGLKSKRLNQLSIKILNSSKTFYLFENNKSSIY